MLFHGWHAGTWGFQALCWAARRSFSSRCFRILALNSSSSWRWVSKRRDMTGQLRGGGHWCPLPSRPAVGRAHAGPSGSASPRGERAAREPRGPLLSSLLPTHPGPGSQARSRCGEEGVAYLVLLLWRPQLPLRGKATGEPGAPSPHPGQGSSRPAPPAPPRAPPAPTFRCMTEPSNHSAWLAIQNMATGKVR